MRPLWGSAEPNKTNLSSWYASKVWHLTFNQAARKQGVAYHLRDLIGIFIATLVFVDNWYFSLEILWTGFNLQCELDTK